MVAELVAAAAAAGYSHWLVEPAADAWNRADPAILGQVEQAGPADAPLVLAGRGRAVTPAFGSYRAAHPVAGMIGLGGSAVLPAGVCRLIVDEGQEVGGRAQRWLARVAFWHGGDAPSADELPAQLDERDPGAAAELLVEIAAFHPRHDAIARCCLAAGRSADAHLRATAMVCIGSALSERWYGVGPEIRQLVGELRDDRRARAARPDFERALLDYERNTSP